MHARSLKLKGSVPMKIESHDQEIRTLLSSGYYRIPRFQRPYSWTRENIQEFWDDIVKDGPADYFIGSMVVFDERNQRFGVVDGQQRLTTIIILLAVLRNTLDDLGLKDLAQGIHNLIESRNINNESEFRLSTESSFPFFQDHILQWGKPEIPATPMKEEENLQNALDQLNSLVQTVVESGNADATLTEEAKKAFLKEKLVGIRDALLGLKVIFIKLDTDDDAYIIFETLNTRGKDLGLADLVKNHLTKYLKSKSASLDQTKVKWERMRETIEGSSRDLETDTYIHHFWCSRDEYFPAKSLFKHLKKKVTKVDARAFLDALVADAVLYRSIHEVSFGKWSKEEKRISESLIALQLFRVQQQTPCVLSLVRAYKASKIKMRHLEDALVAIEKFHFLFTAVTSSRSSGGISGMYASLARRLFGASDQSAVLEVIGELKKKLRERIPSLAEVQAVFPKILYTDSLTKHQKLAKYILVEFYKKACPNITPDYDAMTIEHLIPQSAIGTNAFTDETVGQLGNMILVSAELNQRLDNKAFKDKMLILNGERYPLPAAFANVTECSPQDIAQRTQNMAAIAYNSIWKI